jgi:ABC-type Fe3+ transport system permease subunit
VSARILAKALLWAITAALATTIVFAAFGVSIPALAALKGGGSAKAWAVWGFWTALNASIWVAGVQLPLVFLMGIVWIALVRRQPQLDESRRGLLVGSLIVSLPATLIALMPRSFAWFPNPTARADISTTVAVLMITVFSYLGVLLPRLIVPGMRQGQLVPPIGDPDPEPVR